MHSQPAFYSYLGNENGDDGQDDEDDVEIGDADKTSNQVYDDEDDDDNDEEKNAEDAEDAEDADTEDAEDDTFARDFADAWRTTPERYADRITTANPLMQFINRSLVTAF